MYIHGHMKLVDMAFVSGDPFHSCSVRCVSVRPILMIVCNIEVSDFEKRT